MEQRSATVPILDPASWVDSHGDYLYRYALGSVRNPETAEELVQETLLAALKARYAFRGQSTERSWLTAILKRKVVDWLQEVVRQRARHESLADAPTDELFDSAGKWRCRPSEWSDDDPGRDITRTEFQRVLAECVGRLPTRLRMAFVLRYVDEQSADDLCKTLGTTATNLWVMLHRSRLRIWRCLTVKWFGDDSSPLQEDQA